MVTRHGTIVHGGGCLGIGDARDRLFLRGAPGAARGQAVYLYGTWCLTKTPLVFFSTVNGRGGVKDRFI
jgi:hypothetical protein